MHFSHKIALMLALASLFAAQAAAADAYHCANGRSKTGAMWLSIAHPGLGEYYLQGWGDFGKAPQKKFWLGFIPLYGWPGYLQVKSAIDAHRCLTNDHLTFGE
jgi:hypothetical protein